VGYIILEGEVSMGIVVVIIKGVTRAVISRVEKTVK